MDPEWSTDVEETGQFKRVLHESLIHNVVKCIAISNLTYYIELTTRYY